MRSLLPVLLLVASASAQWTRVDVPTTASFRGLSVVSENVVWASGTEGTVIRTVDGGKTWSVLKVAGAEQLDFRGIKAFDDRSAVIISSGPAEKGQARIFRTKDGGKSWQPTFEEKRAGIFFDAVAFWDRQHGIVLSDPVEGKFALFVSEDGGTSWKQLSPTTLPAALPNEGAFAASNSCLVVQGSSNVWFASGGASVARVFRSHDRGKTWQVSETPMHPKNASSGIFSLMFTDAMDGIAVGGDYQKPDTSDLPNVLQTSDGGKTWGVVESTEPKGVYFSSVVAPPHAVRFFYAAGSKGLFLFANGWSKIAELNFNVLAGAQQGMEPVWAAGPKGTFASYDLPRHSR